MEKNLNFEKIINRNGTNCLKYDFKSERNRPEDVLPLWVADMDFKTSSYVIEALIKTSKHGIFGYSEAKDEYFEAVSKWMKVHHDWTVKKEWLVKTPGVVFALAIAIKAFSKRGDSILIQEPVYYPFSEVIRNNDRVVVSNDLFLGSDGKYHVNFKDFEEKIKKNNVKLFILCSPHNPVGRVWTKDELVKMGDICLKYGVLVVSDEIHNDFAFDKKHIIFSSIKKEYENNSIICTSPSKTFNIASMLISNIFIPNEKNRRKFQKEYEATGMSQLSIFGIIATQVAYEKGEIWYEAMIDYIKENILFTKEFVKKNLPNVSVIDSEGTYLLWLDFRKTGLEMEKLDKKIIFDAKLWLDSGKIFGKSGIGFQRINVACPRAVLKKALNNISEAMKNC